MKNSFKILGAFTFLFALSIAFSAFKANDAITVRVEQWYEYDGTGDRTQAENYVLAGSTSPGCSGADEVCAIKAMDNGFDQPEITSTLSAEISEAINTHSPSENVNLRSN